MKTLNECLQRAFNKLVVCVLLMPMLSAAGNAAEAPDAPSAGQVVLRHGANQVTVDRQGRLLALHIYGDVCPMILPWKAQFVSTNELTSSEITKYKKEAVHAVTAGGASTVQVEVERPDEALLRFEHPEIKVVLRVRLGEDHLELEPVQVINTSSRQLLALCYPEAAYYPIPDDMLAILPTWGGCAYTAKYLRSGEDKDGGSPPASSDLLITRQQGSARGVYALQPRYRKPFRISRFGIIGQRAPGENLTGIYHSLQSWTGPGEADRFPPVRLAVAADPCGVMRAYRRDNQMDLWPNWREKVTPYVAERLPQALHFKLGMFGKHGFADMKSIVEQLPEGMYIVELNHYWHPGRALDVNYPDFTTIAENYGGESQFQEVIDTIHRRGFIASAYTNPTFWMDNTKGVQELGGADKIAVHQADGSILINKYILDRSGFAVGVWRPEVQRFVHNQLREMRDRFGFDMIFQDQYGTRRHDDFSPDFKQVPYAYQEGLIELARTSGEVMGINSEGVGFDHVFCYLTGTMGFYLNTMSGYREESYDKPKRAGLLQQWPLAMLPVRDKVSFYPHNLDIPVRTSENLSWILATGMNLHYTEQQFVQDLKSPRGADTLKALAHIQRTVCSRAFGQLATDFRYLDANLDQTLTTYVNGFMIYANHTPAPVKVDTAGGTFELAPHGFVAMQDQAPVCGLLADAQNAFGLLCDWSAADKSWKPVTAWKPYALEGR